MIEVKVYHDGVVVAKIRYNKLAELFERQADYSASIAVERLGTAESVGLHTVVIEDFERLEFNVLELVRQTLNKLNTEGRTLERDTCASDLARRQRGALPEV